MRILLRQTVHTQPHTHLVVRIPRSIVSKGFFIQLLTVKPIRRAECVGTSCPLMQLLTPWIVDEELMGIAVLVCDKVNATEVVWVIPEDDSRRGDGFSGPCLLNSV